MFVVCVEFVLVGITLYSSNNLYGIVFCIYII
jgi:hypothetical protein